jgi:hypothetical protein
VFFVRLIDPLVPVSCEPLLLPGFLEQAWPIGTFFVLLGNAELDAEVSDHPPALRHYNLIVQLDNALILGKSSSAFSLKRE